MELLKATNSTLLARNKFYLLTLVLRIFYLSDVVACLSPDFELSQKSASI